MEINYLTHKVINYIRFNKLESYYSTALSPDDFKKLFWDKMRPRLSEHEREGFIKGAKLIQFDVLYEAFKPEV